MTGRIRGTAQLSKKPKDIHDRKLTGYVPCAAPARTVC